MTLTTMDALRNIHFFLSSSTIFWSLPISISEYDDTYDSTNDSKESKISLLYISPFQLQGGIEKKKVLTPWNAGDIHCYI